MERTLGLLPKEVHLAPNGRRYVHIYIHTCDQCTRFKQPQGRTEMQPILFSYPLELIHLDVLTLGGKVDDNRSVNIQVVTDHFNKVCAQAYVTCQNRQHQWLLRPCGTSFLVHYG